MSIPGTRTAYNIQVDNVGPLTTTFNPPSTCLATTTYIGNGVAGYYVAAFWDDITACYPTGSLTGTQSLNLHTNFFYSPGICPIGWYPATSMGVGAPKDASDASLWLIPEATNVWLCCPS